MLPASSKPRLISSVVATHRTSTLQAIAQKAHSVTAQIQYLKQQGAQRRDMILNAPGSGQSRLDWIHQQLSAKV